MWNEEMIFFYYITERKLLFLWMRRNMEMKTLHASNFDHSSEALDDFLSKRGDF
jgi:hypothetical protein